MRSGFEIVCREQGLLRAHVIKTHLESVGIPAILDYESAGPAIGVTVDGLGEVRVLVRASLAQRARRVLADVHPAHGRTALYRRRRSRTVRAQRRLGGPSTDRQNRATASRRR